MNVYSKNRTNAQIQKTNQDYGGGEKEGGRAREGRELRDTKILGIKQIGNRKYSNYCITLNMYSIKILTHSAVTLETNIILPVNCTSIKTSMIYPHNRILHIDNS